jgi:hypothetical protein
VLVVLVVVVVKLFTVVLIEAGCTITVGAVQLPTEGS